MKVGVLGFIPKCIRAVNVFLFGFPIVIRYNSGQKVRIRCKAFHITKDDDNTICNWELTSGQVLVLGVTDIESIYSPVL